jgi:hypothetical protein
MTAWEHPCRAGRHTELTERHHDVRHRRHGCRKGNDLLIAVNVHGHGPTTHDESIRSGQREIRATQRMPDQIEDRRVHQHVDKWPALVDERPHGLPGRRLAFPVVTDPDVLAASPVAECGDALLAFELGLFAQSFPKNADLLRRDEIQQDAAAELVQIAFGLRYVGRCNELTCSRKGCHRHCYCLKSVELGRECNAGGAAFVVGREKDLPRVVRCELREAAIESSPVIGDREIAFVAEILAP